MDPRVSIRRRTVGKVVTTSLLLLWLLILHPLPCRCAQTSKTPEYYFKAGLLAQLQNLLNLGYKSVERSDFIAKIYNIKYKIYNSLVPWLKGLQAIMETCFTRSVITCKNPPIESPGRPDPPPAGPRAAGPRSIRFQGERGWTPHFPVLGPRGSRGDPLP